MCAQCTKDASSYQESRHTSPEQLIAEFDKQLRAELSKKNLKLENFISNNNEYILYFSLMISNIKFN